MVILTSTTDSPEQMTAALESRGMEVEKPVVEAPVAEVTETKPAEKETVAAEAAAAVPGTETAPVTGTGEEEGQEGSVEVEGQDGKPERKRKSGWQRKIDKLSTEAEKLRGEKDALERQLAAITAVLPTKATDAPADKKQETAKPAEEAKPELPKRPKREDFQYNEEEYQKALETYETARDGQLAQLTDLNKQISNLQSQLDERAEAAVERNNVVNAKAAAWNAKVTEAKTRYADLDEVLQGDAAKDIKISFAAQAVLDKSKIPVDVYYYLGKHPEEATALFEATETDSLPKDMKEREKADYFLEATVTAAAEIARIEQIIRSEQKPATKTEEKKAAAPVAGSPPQKPETKVSAAPPPARPLAGDTAPGTTKDPGKMNATEWRLFKESPEGKAWRARHNV